ncbi:DUF6126 family protein [Streptomyces lavendulae]|uniref:DUF6126 family protein n=1 Tax=Streptomyces lavendulae TaxID=1914 RepID=UPI00247CC6F1|nr:hypothetical protein [Streptomyces sp. SPB4]
MTKGENMPTTSEKTEAASEAAGAESRETGSTAGTAAGTDAAAQPAGLLGRIESRFPRGLVIRLIAYLFVGHLFAFFVYLLFVLGGQNQ